jgi:amino acid transporter
MSRLVFALSFDRLLPTWAADVSEKSHTPIIATTISTLGIIAVCLLSIYTNVLAVFRNLTLLFLLIYVISSVAAAVLPYRRRDLYDASPKLFGNWGKVPVITIVGISSAIANGIIAYLAATKTQVSGGCSTGSIITLVLTATVGGLAYLISKISMRRQGLDLKLAMTELPPE